MRVFNKQVQTNTALNVNTNGPAVPLKSIFMYSVAANITGTPTGTILLQASNDPETNDVTPLGTPAPLPTNWSTIANTSTNVTTSGTTLWNVSDVGYNYVRVVYTDTSSGASTATMNVVVNGKGM